MERVFFSAFPEEHSWTFVRESIGRLDRFLHSQRFSISPCTSVFVIPFFRLGPDAADSSREEGQGGSSQGAADTV